MERPFLQGLGELLVICRAGGIVAAHAAGDVMGDGLERDAAGLFALGAAADPVRDHHQQGEPLALRP